MRRLRPRLSHQKQKPKKPESASFRAIAAPASPAPITAILWPGINRLNFLREKDTLGVPCRLGILREDGTAKDSLEALGYPHDFYQTPNEESVYFPECGMLNPVTLCQTRLNHSLITFFQKSVTRVTRLKRCELHFSEGEPLSFDHVIYALGAEFVQGEQKLEHALLNTLPFRAVRGQTLLVKPSPESELIRETRVSKAYVSPLAPEITGHHYHLIGATYQAKSIQENQEEVDEAELIARAKESWPEFKNLSSEQVFSHKVGYRLSTPDKLPLIGPICDLDFIHTHYEKAFKGTRDLDLPPVETKVGEWIMMGLGSRGITSSSLGAEILFSLMTGAPLPIPLELWHHLHPGRFYFRNLRKRVN